MDKYELSELTVKLTNVQIEWIDSIRMRYEKATGRYIDREEVIRRTLHHGFEKAELEMRKIEDLKDVKPPKRVDKPKRFGHLTLID